MEVATRTAVSVPRAVERVWACFLWGLFCSEREKHGAKICARLKKKVIYIQPKIAQDTYTPFLTAAGKTKTRMMPVTHVADVFFSCSAVTLREMKGVSFFFLFRSDFFFPPFNAALDI